MLRERLHDTVLPALQPSGGTVPVVEDGDRTKGSGYYGGAAIGTRATGINESVDLGDGGLTSYTAEYVG